ncbi:MAG: STAS domain-containing protein [Acidimicrobiia bacterium]
MTNAGAAPASESGNFRVSTDEQSDGVVLRVAGEVDVYTSPALRDELYRLIDSGAPRVTLDLSDMEFIDSSGLGVFVGALKRVRERASELELRGLQPSTRKVLDITGLVQVFTIVD